MTTHEKGKRPMPDSEPAPTQPLAKRLLTVKETSEILGLSRSTIYELIASDDLEVVRIGRSLRVPTGAVDDFVDRLRSRRAS